MSLTSRSIQSASKLPGLSEIRLYCKLDDHAKVTEEPDLTSSVQTPSALCEKSQTS